MSLFGKEEIELEILWILKYYDGHPKIWYFSEFLIFGSPELKTHVSFVRHPSILLSVCLSACKIVTFSTSPPEPLG